MMHAKIKKMPLNLSKLCRENWWLLFSGHGVFFIFSPFLVVCNWQCNAFAFTTALESNFVLTVQFGICLPHRENSESLMNVITILLYIH